MFTKSLLSFRKSFWKCPFTKDMMKFEKATSKCSQKINHLPLVRSSCQTTPPLRPTYSVGKGRQSGNERRVERTGIRGNRIDTLFLGVATTRREIV